MILSAQGYVCVCERERAIEYACVRVCAQKQEHMIVSAQVCERERESELSDTPPYSRIFLFDTS